MRAPCRPSEARRRRRRLAARDSASENPSVPSDIKMTPPAARSAPMTAAAWDARYAKKGWAYGTEPNAFLRAAAAAHLALGAPLRVLSLGEGQGRNCVHLAAAHRHVCTVLCRDHGHRRCALRSARLRGSLHLWRSQHRPRRVRIRERARLVTAATDFVVTAIAPNAHPCLPWGSFLLRQRRHRQLPDVRAAGLAR